MARPICLAVLLCGTMLGASSHAEETLYMIGNSLTWDSRPRSLGPLAEQIGADLEVGYHILESSTLPTIMEDPDRTSDAVPPSPYGPLSEALPGYTWDFVSMQLHPREGATLATESSAIQTIVGFAQTNADNANTLFYLFQPWPMTFQWDDWLGPVSTDPDTQAVARHDYAYLLLDRVRAQMPSVDFLVIPTGDVFFELDQQMKAGQIPGFSSVNELYRDLTHLTRTGQFVAATTFLATVLGQDPTSPLPVDSEFSNSVALNDDQVRTALQGLVWDVVRNNRATGIIGDMNWDGQIDFDDIQPFALALRSETTFESQFGVPAAVRGDFDGDGNFDFDDVSGMVAHFSSTRAQAMPEPPSGVLVMCGILVLGLPTVREGNRGLS